MNVLAAEMLSRAKSVRATQIEEWTRTPVKSNYGRLELVISFDAEGEMLLAVNDLDLGREIAAGFVEWNRFKRAVGLARRKFKALTEG